MKFLAKSSPANKTKASRWLKIGIISVVLIIFIVAGAVIAVRRVYYDNLNPVSGSQKSQIITIPIGSSPHEVAVILEKAGVIRSVWAFEWYVRNNNYRDKLQ